MPISPELKAAQDEILTAVKTITGDLKEELKGRIETITQRLDEEEAQRKRADGGSWAHGESAGFSLAKSLWESDQFKAFARTGKGRMALAIDTKAAITSAAVGSSTPGILVPERIAGIQAPPARRLRVRDLLPQYPTSAGAVEGVKRSSFTNAASPVAETSTKPESAIEWGIESWPVRTIATWIPAAKQVVDDWAELRAAVDETLIEGLKDAEDSELLAGDGTGQHLSGLLAEATPYDTGLDVANDTRLDKLGHAIGQLETLGYVVDGLVLHPTDWRNAQQTKGTDGHYLLGSAAAAGEPILWGKAVATTTAMAQGTFLVGAFRRAASIRDRQGVTVEVSDSHGDYFIKNMLAIRCEERLALAIRDGAAMVYGTF